VNQDEYISEHLGLSTPKYSFLMSADCSDCLLA